MKKIMLVFGTRPEAIKMCPLVNELKKYNELETVVCVTGQHRQMLDQVLQAFDVKPDYDLSIMKDKQTLFDVTTNILNKIKDVLEEVKPDVVLVHGDTSTTFVTALACFYLQIPVGHVEAGLRTYDIYSPYPEEFNRQAVGIIAKYNFAPTEMSKQNLLNEGKKEENIYVNLDDSGSIDGVYVVNAYELKKDQKITDYGNYSSLTNLSSDSKLNNDNGKITVNGKKGKFYYQGNLDSAKIPWNVDILYELDGKTMDAKNLAGKSGKLKITMKIRQNKGADKDFFENYGRCFSDNLTHFY